VREFPCSLWRGVSLIVQHDSSDNLLCIDFTSHFIGSSHAPAIKRPDSKLGSSRTEFTTAWLAFITTSPANGQLRYNERTLAKHWKQHIKYVFFSYF
jgi:hypothetical protein